jgi:hypothetical protein
MERDELAVDFGFDQPAATAYNRIFLHFLPFDRGGKRACYR